MPNKFTQHIKQWKRTLLRQSAGIRDKAVNNIVIAKRQARVSYWISKRKLRIAYNQTRKILIKLQVKFLIFITHNRARLQMGIYANLLSCKKYVATILSVLLATIFIFGVPEYIIQSSELKASEVHLACAGIIGMALVLVLSLAIIPAQKAADVFSVTVLKLYAKDWETIAVFAALACTTLVSVLLGTNWTLDQERRFTLASQFILLGISLDAVKHFYTRALELLMPETALGLVKTECKNEIARMRVLVDRLTRIHVIEKGVTDMLPAVRATFYGSTKLSSYLRIWVGQLDEFAHKAINRRDTQAANAVISTMAFIAKDYLDSRRDSIVFVPDMSSPLTALSDGVTEANKVSEAVYESIKAICQDALKAENELVVRQCLSTLGALAAHAMSITVEKLGRQTAPLAFGPVFYLDLCAKDVNKTTMEDAQLAAVEAIGSVFSKIRADVDSIQTQTQALEALNNIALAAYGRASKVITHKAVEMMFKASRHLLRVNGYSVGSPLNNSLRYATGMILLEFAMEAEGLRLMQPFPPYSEVYESSISKILADAAERVQPVDPARNWIDPFQEFKEVSEAIYEHFRETAVNFPPVSTQLRRNIIETIIESAKVHIALLDESPSGCSEFSETVEEALRALLYIPQSYFTITQQFPEREAMSACESLACLGMALLERQRPELAKACADGIHAIAKKYAASSGVVILSLADKFIYLEQLARVAEIQNFPTTAADFRAKIVSPVAINQADFANAIQTRIRQMDRNLGEPGREYSLRDDPLFYLRQLIERQRRAS